MTGRDEELERSLVFSLNSPVSQIELLESALGGPNPAVRSARDKPLHSMDSH